MLEEVASLKGRRVVLGVTGGIAAYKSVEVCRRLVDAGAHVIPVLTAAARKFVGDATFSALASERVRSSLFDDEDPIPHVTLGRTAELFLICPATARFLGSYAAGIADDLLGASLLATRSSVVICPAMHSEMWEHPAVLENLSKLKRRGVVVVWPEEGRLAGGDVGAGRLAALEDIVSTAADLLAAQARKASPGKEAPRNGKAPAADGESKASSTGSMAGLQVLVTAGGTREPMDPVRYLGNRSSGKQGYALAEAAWGRGADVSLVATVRRNVPPGVELTLVETASEMRIAVLERQNADVVIMAAAIADYRPVSAAPEKIKKADQPMSITLEPTPDILLELSTKSGESQTLVGFAAETNNPEESAKAKLRRKGVDMLIVNDVSAPLVGFNHDTNAVWILDRSGGRLAVPLASKLEVAETILDRVISLRASTGNLEHSGSGAAVAARQ